MCTTYAKDQLDLYCHVSSHNLLLFVLLSDTVFLSVVVILLLVEMSCFYVHVSNDSLMISSVAMLVLIIMTFCIIFSHVKNDDWSAAQLLEEIFSIRDDDFRVLLVMAEGCQRQN